MKIRVLFDTREGGKNLPLISRFFLSLIKGYNHEKYWRRRACVVDPQSRVPLIVKLYYLYYIKRKDAKLHCSFGTGA